MRPLPFSFPFLRPVCVCFLVGSCIRSCMLPALPVPRPRLPSLTAPQLLPALRPCCCRYVREVKAANPRMTQAHDRSTGIGEWVEKGRCRRGACMPALYRLPAPASQAVKPCLPSSPSFARQQASTRWPSRGTAACTAPGSRARMQARPSRAAAPPAARPAAARCRRKGPPLGPPRSARLAACGTAARDGWLVAAAERRAPLTTSTLF